jgi:hypothetical protein
MISIKLPAIPPVLETDPPAPIKSSGIHAAGPPVHWVLPCSPVAQTQVLVSSKLENFQDPLAQCTFHCNDKVKDSMDVGNKVHLDSCVTKCVDDYMQLILTMTKKMKEFLSSIRK